jgi:hypothetical protein
VYLSFLLPDFAVMGNTHFYGFSQQEYKGKLAHVSCVTDRSGRNCRRLGLISADEFCNESSFSDEIPKETYNNNYLGSGIVNFDLHIMPYDSAGWMSRLRDDVLLVDVALPGSCKAGSAQSVQVNPPWVRSQKYSIITQLILGIRVFDIRSTKAGNDGTQNSGIWTHHGGFKGEKLRRILNCIKIFLEAHPSETVIIVLSDYMNVSESEVYDEISYAAGSFLVNHNGAVNDLTVGTTRGKLTVMNDSFMERHLGPNGREGTNHWKEMLQHLNRIQPMPRIYNRFVTSLKPLKGQSEINETPEYLAVNRGLPGLRKWLHSDDSSKIGIVEAEWFGNCGEISSLIKLIVDKNFMKGNFI